MSEIRHGTTEELLALRDGEGSAWIRAHVAECRACAAELFRLEQMRARLKALPSFTPPRDLPQAEWRWQQEDGERSQEFRKCIECFLCMDTCHVLRNHETEDEFIGPRFLIRAASLEMHPLDQADRKAFLKNDAGIGYCNINKCCTDVCPEHIRITDNGIIPLKERVADDYYDPIRMLWRKLRGEPATPAGNGDGQADAEAEAGSQTEGDRS